MVVHHPSFSFLVSLEVQADVKVKVLVKVFDTHPFQWLQQQREDTKRETLLAEVTQEIAQAKEHLEHLQQVAASLKRKA